MGEQHGIAAGSTSERPIESILGIGYSLLITAEQTDGEYELMKFVAPGGHGPPPHVHRHEDECFYIIDGEFDVQIGDKTIHAGPGRYVHLPRQVPHSFRNTGAQTGSLLCWVIPGNLSGFFDAFKRPWSASAEMPTPPNQEDIEKLMAAAKQYEIRVLV